MIGMGSLLSVNVALQMFCVWECSVFHPKYFVYCEAFVTGKNYDWFVFKNMKFASFCFFWSNFIKALFKKGQEMPRSCFTLKSKEKHITKLLTQYILNTFIITFFLKLHSLFRILNFDRLILFRILN